mgnify:CR=1
KFEKRTWFVSKTVNQRIMSLKDTLVEATQSLVRRIPNFKSIGLLSDILTNEIPLSEKKVNELITFLAKAF